MKLLLIFIFISFIPVHLAKAVNVGTVYSYSAAEPVLDGVLEAAWTDAPAINIILYNGVDQLDTMTITMQLF